MHAWQPYEALFGITHTGSGRVLVHPGVYSPQLQNERHLLVYLPPSYGSGQRSPVLYMHDGQNLFDAATSFVSEWHVDETLEQLATEGLEAIVVGIPNAGDARRDEYSPFYDERHRAGGRGDAYVRFIIETVKPLIDADFETRPERATTGIAGSSLGGSISLYAFFSAPHIFGFAGVMSPALPFADGALIEWVQHAHPVPGLLYVDVGTRELAFRRTDIPLLRPHSRRYVKLVRHLVHVLERKGYTRGSTLCYVEEKGAEHNESAWARRFPHMVRFWLDERHPCPSRPRQWGRPG
nr:alpha/beta hydrolase-fold protein [Ardenticatena sp.]